ncbi:MAG: response regulator [Vicinamibacterales bacterium]
MAATPTVLVVDDYPDALQVWSLYLRSAGFEVLTAADGRDALAQIGSHHPDLVVLDLELPGLSGFQVARQLREQPETRTLPLIAATGYSYTKQLDQARQAGFDAILVKPCDPDTLVAEIRRLLADRQASIARSNVSTALPRYFASSRPTRGASKIACFRRRCVVEFHFRVAEWISSPAGRSRAAMEHGTYPARPEPGARVR